MMPPPKFIPRPKPQDPDTIHTHSIVSHRTRRGIVVVGWGDKLGQFDPEDARRFAHTILRECDNAETDSFIYSHFKELLTEEQAAFLLSMFRGHRATLEQAAGLRSIKDELPEEDRR